MHAAVVHSFTHPPRYETVPTPEPSGEHELLVEVLASGLHPRVRSSADGSHYTSTDELPLIPGIDGVGRTADGELVYFVLPDTRLGAMAEHTLVDRRRSVRVPADADPAVLAAGMNPAMSAWIALRRRIDFRPGARVLVLGAGGNAGRMAVQVARHLGASEVIEVVRGTPLEGLEADVVLDYLWGEPAERTMIALATHSDRPVESIQIGSVAGPSAAVPSAALRATGLRIVGSGQGSVATRAIVEELPALAAELAGGTFTVDPVPLPLSDVEAAWSERHAGRVVFTP